MGIRANNFARFCPPASNAAPSAPVNCGWGADRSGPGQDFQPVRASFPVAGPTPPVRIHRRKRPNAPTKATTRVAICVLYAVQRHRHRHAFGQQPNDLRFRKHHATYCWMSAGFLRRDRAPRVSPPSSHPQPGGTIVQKPARAGRASDSFMAKSRTRSAVLQMDDFAVLAADFDDRTRVRRHVMHAAHGT